MSDVAIRVENLSKQYRIGGPQVRYKTIRESLSQTMQAPFRRLSAVVRGQASVVLEETIWALKDVSFEVKRGDVVGVIGRNGAGKTTLLKILSRITEPTEGRARLRGRVGSLLEVGTGFHPELTGRENIYLNGAILGMKQAEIELKFDEMVAFAEIEKFIDTPVKYYSSGMYVRLAFAVAAHLEPEILVVDEVLAVGDAAFQKKCLGKMEDVARGGRTVLFVSHNLAAVSSLCTRGIWLDRGRLRVFGSTNKAVESYLESTGKRKRVPLRKRQDRTGDGRLRFTELQFEDGGGRSIDVIASGQNLRLILAYETSDGQPVNGVKVGILVFGLLGEFLFMCKSDLTQGVMDNLPRKGYVTCDIPQLPLPPGQYPLTVWAKVGGVWADRLEQAAQLSVVAGDFFGTGKLPPAHRRGMLVHHSWGVEDPSRMSSAI